MHKFNFIFALILVVAAVCGCNFSYELGGGENSSRSSRKTETASRKSTESANSETAAKDVDAAENVDSGDQPSAAGDDAEAAEDAGDFSSFAGKWIWARTGSSTTTAASGVYIGGNGSRFTYEFDEDGAVEFTGIMSVMQAGCTMQIFKNARGQATLDGDNLRVEWQPASFSRKDSCSAAQDYDKTLPAETETLTVEFKNSGGQEQLCLTGKDETCFSRAE